MESSNDKLKTIQPTVLGVSDQLITALAKAMELIKNRLNHNKNY